jgi:hypothetical protein
VHHVGFTILIYMLHGQQNVNFFEGHFDRSILQVFSEKLITNILSDCASGNMVDGVALITSPPFCYHGCCEKINRNIVSDVLVASVGLLKLIKFL